jgi:hypothetical protein
VYHLVVARALENEMQQQNRRIRQSNSLENRLAAEAACLPDQTRRKTRPRQRLAEVTETTAVDIDAAPKYQQPKIALRARQHLGDR